MFNSRKKKHPLSRKKNLKILNRKLLKWCECACVIELIKSAVCIFGSPRPNIRCLILTPYLQKNFPFELICNLYLAFQHFHLACRHIR